MNTSLSQPMIRFGDPLIISRDPFSIDRKIYPDDTLISRKFPSTLVSAVDYLHFIEQYIPKELISHQNFSQLTDLANILSGNLTSFLIFESRLGTSDARSDYCFAVSSMNGEREHLKNLIKSRTFPETLLNQSEWQQIENFATVWADFDSVLNNKIRGIWFEFDTATSSSETLVPSVFIHLLLIRASSTNKTSKYNWLTNRAIPLLIGKQLSDKAKKQILNCIQMLPQDAAIFQIGAMLSRATNNIRLVIKRIDTTQIIPYLISLGWSDKNDELSSLLKELNNYVSRIVLHIGVGEQIDPKIGIECSFYPNQYHEEKGWSNFLNYLMNKGLCLPEKQSALINFTGIGRIDSKYEYDQEKCIPSVMLSEEGGSGALIRYISHIKITYQPNHPLEAKAYTAVRHFG